MWGADFFERVYVKGRRQRIGAQFDWTPGPTGLKAEWMQSREQRLNQSNRNEDLSDFITTGWYVSGTWFITGEDKDDNINPRKPLFRGGIGAVELGVRFDELGFRQREHGGHGVHQPARRSPGAELRPDLDLRRELDAHPLGPRRHQRRSTRPSRMSRARRFPAPPRSGRAC